jgi:hypothetical protein
VAADARGGGAKGRADLRAHLTFGSVRPYLITTGVIFALLAVVHIVEFVGTVRHRGDLWYIVVLAVIAAVCIGLATWAWRVLAGLR